MCSGIKNLDRRKVIYKFSYQGNPAQIHFIFYLTLQRKTLQIQQLQSQTVQLGQDSGQFSLQAEFFHYKDKDYLGRQDGRAV